MGGLLVVIFLTTIVFVSGLILAFATDERGRKYGMWMIAVGLVFYFLCWALTPNTTKFHFDAETEYGHY